MLYLITSVVVESPLLGAKLVSDEVAVIWWLLDVLWAWQRRHCGVVKRLTQVGNVQLPDLVGQGKALAFTQTSPIAKYMCLLWEELLQLSSQFVIRSSRHRRSKA